MSRKASKWPDLLSQSLNDDGNAQRIKTCYGDQLLYCKQECAWRVWDSRRWVGDELQARTLAKNTMQQFADRAGKSQANDRLKLFKFAQGSLNEGRLRAALASLETYLPADAVGFDQSPHLLNFCNGTLDLRTSVLSAHNPADRITRLVDYN